MGSRSYSRSRSPSPRKSGAYSRSRSRSPIRPREIDRRSPRYERSRPYYRDSGRGGRYDDRSRRPRNHDGRENPRPSNCLGIFGMSMNTSERDIREIFERYGHVDSVKIILDHATGRSRGFGFVSFEERDDATRAREKIADTMIDGMKVRVDYAIQNRRHSPYRNRSPPRKYSPPRRSLRYSRSPPPRAPRYSRSPPPRSARYSRSPSR
uniref:RRM domain-containing protein n=1 Tax=Panagrolaimus sp. ES5 TaxID=591445 RepID=A0AC34GR79_9BILA